MVVSARAQTTTDSVDIRQLDSLIARDTNIVPDAVQPIQVANDSVCKRPLLTGGRDWKIVPGVAFSAQVLKRHPYFNFNTRPISVLPDVKIFHGKEVMFYVIVALLLLFALFKLAFAKYFSDLFRVFFRTTMKQRQIREQLMQAPLASLVFNVFFVASVGLYIDFLLQYYDLRPVANFWLLYLYCAIGITVIYLVKFIGLKICGWLFNMKQAADSYIFIVFIINKVIGIFLVPFLVMLAFMDGVGYTIAMVLSWCGIGLLLLYRFILGFSTVRNEVRFNLFHFFLYFVAFEVAPLLLIYRLLLLLF